MLLDVAPRRAGHRFVPAGETRGRLVNLDVSVVVPTYRRPALLRRCLQALCRQTLDFDRYEIIVADDAAGGETQVICAEFGTGSGQGERPLAPGRWERPRPA